MRVNLIIDIEEHRVNLVIAFVGQRNSRILAEWHWEKAIQCAVGPNRERNRVIEKIFAESQAEEVSQWRLHARARLSVPIHSQNQGFQIVRTIAGESHPDVHDDSRT